MKPIVYSGPLDDRTGVAPHNGRSMAASTAQSTIEDEHLAHRIDGSGWYAAPNAIFNVGFTPNQIAVYLYLLRLGGADAGAFPSLLDIAGAVGLSRRTVSDVVASLVDSGWVDREPNVRPNGSTTSYIYRLNVGVVQNLHGGSAKSAPPYKHLSIKRESKDSLSCDFDDFWATYPKRKGPNPKQVALKSYERARKTADHAAIMRGLLAFKRSESENIGTPYIPMASTWLNQQRWADEYEQSEEPNLVLWQRDPEEVARRCRERGIIPA